jgi:hypothetical protein
MKPILAALLFLGLVPASAAAQNPAGTPLESARVADELTCEQINAEGAALNASFQQSATLASERKEGSAKKRRMLLGPLGSVLSRKKSAQAVAPVASSAQLRMEELLLLSNRKGC